VTASFISSWHDVLPTDADRDRLLKPLIPRLVGTKSDSRVEERRAYMALDWLFRVHAPTFLELLPSLTSHAQTMRNLPEITDSAGATVAGGLARNASEAAAAAKDAVGPTVEGTRRAWFAAWEAAGDAVRASAGDAAREAAGDVVGGTARTAVYDAAWDAAAVVAWSAAEAAALASVKNASGEDVAAYAAWDAAVKALAPTVELLQPSAVDLTGRMIDTR
jgi:hypothetical protein